MKLTLVRNACLLLDIGGKRILVDPMLRDAATTPAIENTPNPRPNPLVDLPFPAADVVAGVEGCIVTHLHGDHFDAAAVELLPKDLPILTQPASAGGLRAHGFTEVKEADGTWLGLDVRRTAGRHGTGPIGEAMGPVSGFVVEGLYIAGDTIWCDEVAGALAAHDPHTVVVNAGGARFLEGGPIVMTVDDVRAVRAATEARLVVVHLEAVNHCIELRPAYRAIDGVDVPEDGDALELQPV